MNKQDFEMMDKHRKDLARRTIILILSVCLISYLFKILGSTLFNKFITNPAFIKASNIIDTTYWLNILCYGLLGNIITLLTFCMACRKLRLKWFEYLIIFLFSISIAIFRDTWIGPITYLFDVLQYIFFPTLYGCLTRRVPILENLMYTLIMYFAYNGIILINTTLCDLKAIMYASNFIAYILCLIEVYLFITAYTIFIINGGVKYGKSSINSK